jgi:plastocyanin
VIVARIAMLAALFTATAVLAASTHEVTLAGLKFQPAQLTVQRGDTVTWKNTDVVPHTATAKGKFDSGTIAPGKSYSRKMDQAGEFDYICTVHPNMQAKLTVK